MFDRAEIIVQSGNGGKGVVSFRHEKFVPLGGPDGGDGGKGGDIFLKVNNNIDTLKAYYHKRHYTAEDGKPGSRSRKHGRNGRSIILELPAGTVVTDITNVDEPVMLFDLDKEGEQVVLVKGGRGGLGNTHFSSSVNQAPRLASDGSPGEQKKLLLELKLIADVGIIGLPNAGKSSLLAASSKATPKIANYPFTTMEPELGTVEINNRVFVLADIPGIIEGAYEGKGLGHDFLRHVVRTRLLIHLIDGSQPEPVEDFKTINREMALYDRQLVQKKQLVVINKIDLPQVSDSMAEIIQQFAVEGIRLEFISALTGEGVAELLEKVRGQLEKLARPEMSRPADQIKIFRPKPRYATPAVTQQGGKFVIHDDELERVVTGSDVSDVEVRRQLWGLIEKRIGPKTLTKMGIMPGDVITIGNWEWRW
jgi:GTP-binding protein